MKCLILAGGFATRLWPFTEHRAKPLLPLAGKPLIASTLERIPKDIPIIISTNRAYAQDFEDFAKNYKERKIQVFIEDSQGEEGKLGALGGVSLAIRTLKIQDNLLLLAGDNYFGFPLADFISKFRGTPFLATYDIGDLNEAKKFGVVVEQHGRAIEFQEKPENPKSTLVSSGCYIIPENKLGDIVEYAKVSPDNLGGVFEYFMSKGEEIRVYPFKDAWFDIGSFQDYLRAHKFLLDGQKIVHSENVENSELLGSIVVESNVKIKDSHLTDCVVLEGAEICDCNLRSCIVDKNVKLTGVDLNFKIVREGLEINAKGKGCLAR